MCAIHSIRIEQFGDNKGVNTKKNTLFSWHFIFRIFFVLGSSYDVDTRFKKKRGNEKFFF